MRAEAEKIILIQWSRPNVPISIMKNKDERWEEKKKETLHLNGFRKVSYPRMHCCLKAFTGLLIIVQCTSDE